MEAGTETSLRDRRQAVIEEHMESENTHDFDVTMETFEHPRYELIPTGEVYDGVDEVNEYYRTSREAFPDQRNENVVFHHTDDAVIVEFDLLGTHEGEIRGIAPTHKSFRARMCAFFFFAEGTDRITLERIYFDQATIMQQLMGDGS